MKACTRSGAQAATTAVLNRRRRWGPAAAAVAARHSAQYSARLPWYISTGAGPGAATATAPSKQPHLVAQELAIFNEARLDQLLHALRHRGGRAVCRPPASRAGWRPLPGSSLLADPCLKMPAECAIALQALGEFFCER